MTGRAQFALAFPRRRGLVAGVVLVELVATAVAQFHFSSPGRPQVQQQASQLQGSLGANSLGSLGATADPRAGSFGRPAGAFNTEGSGHGKPDHLQLLGLSAELTRQARFKEAKAALAAAAQMTGGSPEVLAQAELLRWRMGLRQLEASVMYEWLGWRRDGAGGTDASFAGSLGGMGDRSQPGRAEAPLSAPRVQLPGSSVDVKSGYSFAFMFSLVASIVVIALGVFVGRRLANADGSKEEVLLNNPMAVQSPAQVLPADMETQDESLVRDGSASDPACTDDDFLAGLAGLDDQQLSGIGSHLDESSRSEDGDPSRSEDVDAESRQECIEPADTESAARDLLEQRAQPPATNFGGSQGRQSTLQSSDGPVKGESATWPASDDCGQSRRWARSADAEGAETALAAVEDLLMDEEGWEGSAPLEGLETSESDPNGAVAADVQGADGTKREHQGHARWGAERRQDVWTAEEEEQEDSEDEEDVDEVDDPDILQASAREEQDEDTPVDMVQDGYADDEWEDVGQDGFDGAAHSPSVDDESHACRSGAALDDNGQHGGQLNESERRTLLLSKFLPGRYPGAKAERMANEGEEVDYESPLANPDYANYVAADEEEVEAAHGDETCRSARLQGYVESSGAEKAHGWGQHRVVGDHNENGHRVVRDHNENGQLSDEEEEEYEEDEEEEEDHNEAYAAGAATNVHEAAEADDDDDDDDDDDGDEWAWGHDLDKNDVKQEADEQTAEAEEREAAVLAFAANWKLKDSVSDVWFAGPSGPGRTWLATDTGPRPLVGDHKKVGASPSQGSALTPQKTTKTTSGRVAPQDKSHSSEDNYKERAPLQDKSHSNDDNDKEAAGGVIYFASTDGRTGRTWYPSSAAAGKTSTEAEVRKQEDAIPAGFVLARPTRFRPTGCYVRALSGGTEAFLPVEHMLPRTEAVTTAIRDRLKSINPLLVRVMDEENVSMLSEDEFRTRANELEGRRRRMDEGIALLRERFDPKKFIKGTISAVQPNGVYVSVIEGKDAFVPVAEMPTKLTAPDEQGQMSGKSKPTVEAGRTVDLRVIRYTWDTDSFVASMLSYEESVAKKGQRQNKGGEGRGEGRQAWSGPQSAPAAVTASNLAQPLQRNAGAEDGNDRPQEQAPELSKAAKRLAAKGFSIVDSSTASGLNTWLSENTAAMKGQASKSKLMVKSEKSYIVNAVRGMNGKVIGQLNLPTRFTDQEIKQAALELITKEGELKAGQDHKGITITKNIISVKL